MSVKQTNELWRRECDALRMHLLHAVCDCADDDGLAYPSISYLAWKANMPRSTITDFMREFRSNGIIRTIGRRSEIQPSIAPYSPADTTVIQIDLTKLTLKTPWRRGSTAAVSEGVREADNGGTPQHGGVVRHSKRGSPPEGNRNKEEPSLEPSLEPSERTPDNLHPVAYATKLLEELSMTHVRSNITSACAALELLIREGKGKAAAYEFLLAMALDARDRGELVDRWWFTDAKWKQVNGGPKRGQQSRNEASNAAIERAFEDTTENP